MLHFGKLEHGDAKPAATGRNADAGRAHEAVALCVDRLPVDGDVDDKAAAVLGPQTHLAATRRDAVDVRLDAEVERDDAAKLIVFADPAEGRAALVGSDVISD